MFLRHQVQQIWKATRRWSDKSMPNHRMSPGEPEKNVDPSSPRKRNSTPNVDHFDSIGSLQKGMEELRRLLMLHIRHESTGPRQTPAIFPSTSAHGSDSPLTSSNAVVANISYVRHAQNAFGTNGVFADTGPENGHQ